MTEFAMVCGIPGSGKTYFANNLVGYNVHSSDTIRGELNGSESDQTDNASVFSELHKRVKSDLMNEKNCVYDATNINWKRRRAFLSEISKINCRKTLYVMATPLVDCIKRNHERGRVVPCYVIIKMYRDFSFPCYFEGWDEIKLVWDFVPKQFNFDKLMEFAFKYDQGTRWHELTLGEHLTKAAEYIKQETSKEYLYFSALLHDIGKPFCKSTKEKPDGIVESIYYDHHNVSAYDAMFYLKAMQLLDGCTCELSDEEIIKVCSIIRWHMQPYFCKQPKTLERYKGLWGEELFDDIMLIHSADKYAH